MTAKKFTVGVLVGLFYAGICLLAVSLASCDKGPSETRSDRLNTTIEMHWLPRTENVTATCHLLGLKTQANGCARSKPDEAYVCEIYAVEPKSFSDESLLAILGHEVWHCLGATHPG